MATINMQGGSVAKAGDTGVSVFGQHTQSSWLNQINQQTEVGSGANLRL